ncbi:polynucleotide adenylyltransferase PcnB [Motiliproteus coralliicola]|uniref:Poly(A) polymerase I n=1 Tax=Motiliproteus coralliicola TaxID=2283196 RepID=A0A369WF11_9GAMM|nr:polynucleotide adenylyltransferase PcnB [Motiliproteus coralliicola]
MDSSPLLGICLALLPWLVIGFLLVSNLRNGKPSSNAEPNPGPDSDPMPDQGPRIIARDHHQLSRRQMSDNALKVLYRLKDGGYEGYLVGGCVRDLLLGEKPKDFDVATEAHPEEVHDLFRNSRLIGRRFKLVHVRFGREIIEVATFRASHQAVHNDDEQHGKQSDSGLILRDNVYGTVEEDALRRDFTVNALYYSIKDFSIHDYANGLQDLDNRILRMIGDPEERYREDPVRMLRAIRFAAKLEFVMAPETEEPIKRLAYLLNDIPAARLFEEVLKLFLSGQGETTFAMLRHFKLFEPLFPLTHRLLESEQGQAAERLIVQALRNTDARVKRGQSVTPAFLYAAMLWYPMQQVLERLKSQGVPPIPALHQAAQEIHQRQSQASSIPRRFSGTMRDIWELQYRLPRRNGNRANQLLEHPRFRAAYDFLLMREASGEQLDGLGQWWTEFQSARNEQREQMIGELGSGQARKRRRPRRRKPKASA